MWNRIEHWVGSRQEKSRRKWILPHALNDPRSTYEAKRRRLVCRLNGHMWTVAEFHLAEGWAILECFRCYPHKDSQREVMAYNPFTRSQT